MYNHRDKYSCDPAAKQKKYRNGVPHNGVRGRWRHIKTDAPVFCPERESDTRFSISGFFRESVSCKGRFEFLRKFAEIFATQ
jgi:hypothetical protein